jgi:hypothetical protein
MLEKLNLLFPDWNEFPPKLWLKVFGYLNGADLNAVHLVSQKFHCLANKIGHCLRLDLISSSRRFKESNRTYKQIRGSEFQEDSEVDFKIENFAGVKLLSLRKSKLSPSFFYKLLEMLPNLEHLFLTDLQQIGTEDQANFPELVLPKLQDIDLCEIDEKFTRVINGMKCLGITGIKYFFHETGKDLMPFVDLHLASIRKLKLCNLGESFDFTPRLQNFNAGNLVSLYMFGLGIDTPTLARIFTNRLKLKRLALFNIGMTDGTLNTIFNSCPDLEVLQLAWSFESTECLNGIQKLKKLRILMVSGLDMNHDHQILRGLMVEVNPNVERLFLNLNLNGITVEFLTELSSFIPNLKELEIHQSCPKEIKDVIPMLFKRIGEVSP